MIHLDNPARMAASIASYADALHFFQSSRTGKLGHNTYVVNRVLPDGRDSMGIKYHQTVIVTYVIDGSIILDSGGYQTYTTKSHMNSVLPPGMRVYQDKHDWYVTNVNGTDLEFYDGMVLDSPDRLLPPPAHWEKNPMRRPTKGDDLSAMGFGGLSLREAQAIYDRAHRKGAEPDPRARMLAEQRRKPVGGITMKDYRKAIREPLAESAISPMSARREQLAAAYPLDIWREGGPQWEGPFSVIHHAGRGATEILAKGDTLEEATAAMLVFHSQGYTMLEVADRHNITVAEVVKERDRRARVEYMSNPQRSEFSDGGFVLHKIDGHTSAWYDAKGTLLDAESRDRLGRMRPVQRDGPAWQRLQSLGRVYLKNPGGKGDAGQSEFQRYTTPGERGVATRLVRRALKRGWEVSVHDGEEWAIEHSTKERDILNALATTGQDTLRFFDNSAKGWVLLVWGNDPSGEELIADHTDNADMAALVQETEVTG
jgi:hypothetical protein